MSQKLTDEVVKLIEGKNFAHLATLMKDGSPQVTPVWVDHDEDRILINTAVGRIKEKNVVRDPRVAISIIDQSNPYHRVVIRGKVIKMIRRGARDHINKLSIKYTGHTYNHVQPGETRVIMMIESITNRT